MMTAVAQELDLTPTVVNIDYYRGDGRPVTLHFWNDTAHTVPTNLTSPARTWKAQLRKNRSINAAVEAELTVDVSAAATGTISVNVPAVSAPLLDGEYVWDLQWLLTGATLPFTCITGDWNMTGDVSRA